VKPNSDVIADEEIKRKMSLETCPAPPSVIQTLWWLVQTMPPICNLFKGLQVTVKRNCEFPVE